MDRFVYIRYDHAPFNQGLKYVYSVCQKILEERTYKEEREIEDYSHDQYEYRDRRVFTRQDIVYLRASFMFTALMGFDDTLITDFRNERESHVRHGGAVVEAPFRLHLSNDVFESVDLVVIEFKKTCESLVPF